MAYSAEHYLPHQSPMVMLDDVHSVGEDGAECSVTLSKDGVLAPFLDAQGRLPNWFAIELMAQTIGVWRVAWLAWLGASDTSHDRDATWWASYQL